MGARQQVAAFEGEAARRRRSRHLLGGNRQQGRHACEERSVPTAGDFNGMWTRSRRFLSCKGCVINEQKLPG